MYVNQSVGLPATFPLAELSVTRDAYTEFKSDAKLDYYQDAAKVRTLSQGFVVATTRALGFSPNENAFCPYEAVPVSVQSGRANGTQARKISEFFRPGAYTGTRARPEKLAFSGLFVSFLCHLRAPIVPKPGTPRMGKTHFHSD